MSHGMSSWACTLAGAAWPSRAQVAAASGVPISSQSAPAAAATVAIATSKTHGKDNAHAKPLTRPVAIADTGGADAATPANKAATASSAVRR